MEDVSWLVRGHGHDADARRVDLGRRSDVGRPPAVRRLRDDEPRRARDPGSKWNLAADAPPLKRVGRRAYKRARGELEMLQREARPKTKPVKTL